MFDNEQPHGRAFALTIYSGACHRWGVDKVLHWTWGWLLTFRKYHPTSCCRFVVVFDTTGFLYFCSRKPGEFAVCLKCFYSFVSWWTMAVIWKIALYETNYKNRYNYRIYIYIYIKLQITKKLSLYTGKTKGKMCKKNRKIKHAWQLPCGRSVIQKPC